MSSMGRSHDHGADLTSEHGWTDQQYLCEAGYVGKQLVAGTQS